MPDNEISMTVDTRLLRQIIQELPGKLDAFGRMESQELVNDIRLSMQQSPASGKTYGVHVASAPGNPPRIDTSALINSIRWTPDGHLRWLIHDGVEYGYMLEDGVGGGVGRDTKTGRFVSLGLKPRPFMQPAFEGARRGFAMRLRAHLSYE